MITLIAGRRERPTAESLSAFGTPTVVPLVGALLVSAIMSAPWHSLFAASVALVICNVGGIAYGAIVIRRTRRQTYYTPVWQDWLWYATLLFCVSTALALGAAFLRSHTHVALFVIAAAALGLLLIGIHNAWDTVTHIVAPDAIRSLEHAERRDRPAPAASPELATGRCRPGTSFTGGER